MQTLPAKTDQLRVTACPHPFKLANQDFSFAPSISVAQVLREIQPDPLLRRRAHIWVNDAYVTPEKWESTYPAAGSEIDIRVVPSGGEGRLIGTIFIAIAAIAAAVLIPGLGVFAAGGALAGWGGVFGGLAAIAIGVVGNMALNALFPPVQPGGAGTLSVLSAMPGLTGTDYGQSSPTLSITGAQNKANTWGPVPFILGKFRVAPFYGAKPYTESAGGEQYIRLIFIWGFAPLQLEDPRILDTGLENYPGLEVEHRNLTLLLSDQTINIDITAKTLTRTEGSWLVDGIKAGSTLSLGGCTTPANDGDYMAAAVTDLVFTWLTGPATTSEVGNGDQTASITFGDEPLTLYTQSIQETALAIELEQNEENISTSDTDADELSIDVACNSLMGVNPDGSSYAMTVNFMVTYRETGTSGAWLTPSGTDAAGAAASAIAMTGNTKSQVRGNLRWKVPARGQYDIKVKRTTAPDSIWTSSVSYWVALRTITNEDPIDFPHPLAMTAMRIKASGRLNGTVDEFKGTITSICPDWDAGTSTWITRATQNPASLYRLVLQGLQNQKPLPDSRIDLANLQYWHAYCATQGWKHNKYIDYNCTVEELIKEIAAASRAAYTRIDSKVGVIIDEPQTFTTGPAFTPRNVVKDSFKSNATIMDRPHAFRCPFINEAMQYQQDERIVPSDGYLIDGKDAWGVTKVVGDPFSATQNYAEATIFEQLDLPGVTDPELIFRHARYHDAVARLRGFEAPQFGTDIEWLVATRGDRIKFAQDVMLAGLSWGRVKALVLEVIGYEGVSDYPPAQSDTYVKATSKYGVSYWPYFATDPAKSLTGASLDNSWLSAAGSTAQQCLHIDLGIGKTIIDIHYENYHNNGNVTSVVGGAKNFILMGSNDPAAFADTAWANDTGWVEIASGVFDIHVALNQADPKVHSVTGAGEYRYYRLKLADNWGHLSYLGLRRIELQEAGDPIYSGALAGVTTDELLPMEAGKSYVLRFRLVDNTSLLCPINTVAGEPKAATFTTPIDGGDDWPAVGDLFLFGETDLEALDLLIKSIQPDSNQGATVMAVPYDENIYLADVGTIPDHDPKISTPPAWSAPLIGDIRSDGSALYPIPGGGWQSRVLVTLTRPSGLDSLINGVEGQYWVTGSDEAPINIPVALLDSGEVSILPVTDGQSYDFRLRYVKKDGTRGPWTVTQTHVVEGKTAPPEDVTGFSVYQVQNVVNFSWTENPDRDIAGYELRYGAVGIAWADALLITTTTLTTSFATPMLPAGTMDYLIKAIDTSGNYSATETRKSFKVMNFYEILLDDAYAPIWPGTLTNYNRNPLTGELNPKSQDLATGDNQDVFDSYVLNPEVTSEYEVPEIDMGADIAVRAWARIYSQLGPGEGGVNAPKLYFDYKPEGGAYAGWAEWTIGSVVGRYFKFKVVNDNTAGLVKLTDFQPILDKTL